MKFEQEQLDALAALAELDDTVGTAWDVAEAVEDLGFEIRDTAPGVSRIYLTGCCSPTGEDVQVGRIVKTEECEAGWRIMT